MIPWTETPNPLYNPVSPSALKIFVKQSPSPLNSLFPAPANPPFPPTSAASLVLAKSRGYTKQREVAPAAPPEAKFPAKYLQNWVLLSTPPKKTCLYLSLKAKLRAWVGKYRMTLAKFPLQKDRKPCSLGIRTKQSTIPVVHQVKYERGEKVSHCCQGHHQPE